MKHLEWLLGKKQLMIINQLDMKIRGGGWSHLTLLESFSSRTLINSSKFSVENESARMREKILDQSIAMLRQTYNNLVKKGNICSTCTFDEGETSEKEKVKE